MAYLFLMGHEFNIFMGKDAKNKCVKKFCKNWWLVSKPVTFVFETSKPGFPIQNIRYGINLELKHFSYFPVCMFLGEIF